MNIAFSVDEPVWAIMNSGVMEIPSCDFDEHMHAFITELLLGQSVPMSSFSWYSQTFLKLLSVYTPSSFLVCYLKNFVNMFFCHGLGILVGI